jgi:serine/threonine-protein phosphatase PGAM5
MDSYWCQEDQREWDEEWDNEVTKVVRAAQGRGKYAERGMEAGIRRVIFIRHAQPGDAADGLSGVGKEQAEVTGQRLREQLGDVDAVYHAGSPEAQRTAEIICSRLSAGKKRAVEVFNMGEALAECVPALPSPSPPAFADIPEAELADAGLKAETAIRAHVWTPGGLEEERVSTEIVVSHGNIIRYMICRALQLSPTTWSRFAAHHCSISEISVDMTGAVQLREFGGVGHLPRKMVTY